jgi:hypothetical protein
MHKIETDVFTVTCGVSILMYTKHVLSQFFKIRKQK